MEYSTIASTSTTATTTDTTATNPDAVLGKDDFMKLLLTELQYQDPTDPMDSDKILTQTSELATLESADNTNKTMEKLVDQLSSNMDMGALSAIGKMASLGTNQISLPESGDAQFDVYFQNPISNGTMSISDKNGNTVRTIPLDSLEGKNGTLSFSWDGKDDSGKQLDAGSYSVTAQYTDSDGDAQQTQYGIYPVESVRYDSGKAYMKLGSSYVAMDKVEEFF